MKHFSAAVIAASWFTITTAAFNAKSNTNVVTYWGQGPNQPRLVEICKNADIDIVNIAFVLHWGPGKVVPATNFGNQCGTDVYIVDGKPTKLLSYCPLIGPDIKSCQETYGKKILLSLGGDGNPNYYLEDTASAKYLTDFLWGAFGPVTDAWEADNGPRPFGDAVVDGFDFDIESVRANIPVDSNGNKIKDWASRGYAKMAQHFRDDLFPRDTTKTYYLSGSPQCSYPDPHLNPAIKMAHFDFLFIQFYNTPACSARAGVNHKKASQPDISFVEWAKALKGTGTRLYFGLPASPKAVPGHPNHYLAPKAVQTLLKRFMPKYSKQIGGISLWEATYARKNVICDAQYFHWMKKALERTIPGGVAARAEDTFMLEDLEDRAACNPWAGQTKSKREARSSDEYPPQMYSSLSIVSSTSSPASSPTTYQPSTATPSVYTTSPAAPSMYSTLTESSSSVSASLSSSSDTLTSSSSLISSSTFKSTVLSAYTEWSYSQYTSEATSHPTTIMTHISPLPTTQSIESTFVLTSSSTTEKPYTSTNGVHPTTPILTYSPKPLPTKYVSTSEISEKPSSSATGHVTSESVRPLPESKMLYTTIMTTTFIDVCPTGLTTKTATYQATVKPGRPSSSELPKGWTITKTLCTQCGPIPTQLTITRPAYPSVEATTTFGSTAISLPTSSVPDSRSNTFHSTRTRSLLVTTYTTAPPVQSSSTSTVISTTFAETMTNINYVTISNSKDKPESPTTLVSFITPVSSPASTLEVSIVQSNEASSSTSSKSLSSMSTKNSIATSIGLPVIVTTYAPSTKTSAIPYSIASSSSATPASPTNDARQVRIGSGLVLASVMAIVFLLV